MGEAEIVDSRPFYGVVCNRKGPWILPELWKTLRPRFPQLLGRRQGRRPQAPPAQPLWLSHWE